MLRDRLVCGIIDEKIQRRLRWNRLRSTWLKRPPAKFIESSKSTRHQGIKARILLQIQNATAAASHTKRQAVDLKMPSVLTAGNEVTKPKPAVISRQGGATREPSPAGRKLNNLVNEMARIAKGKKNSQRI